MKIVFIIKGVENAESIGIMYICSLLKKHGHITNCFCTEGADLYKLMEDIRPDIIGYSICTGFQDYYQKLNLSLKERFSFISIFGGPHPTFFPNFIEEKGVDIICRGEGEYAILELCNSMVKGEDITNIENLWLKINGQIFRNKLRPLISNLDKLPWPDRESSYSIDPTFKDYGVKSFVSTRGCPFECSYCFNGSFKDIYGISWNKCRRRSPLDLVNEIYEVKNTSCLKFVQFRCSIFPWSTEWLKEFSRYYKEKIGLPFYCHVRADLLNEENVKLMAIAGCVSVNMGIECGDEIYRNTVLNRTVTNQQIEYACRILHSNGIKILADNMVCLPGGSFELDIETFEFNRKCKIDYPLTTILQPYPGTKIEKYCIDNGYYDGDHSKLYYNYYNISPLKFNTLKEKRMMENFHKLFAFVSEYPILINLIKRLCILPSNIFFLTIFKLWYAWCNENRIIPFERSIIDKKETWQVLFGKFKTDKYEN